MPYVEKITVAGKTVEIEKFYTSRYGSKGQKRKDRVKPTPEQQKKVNTRAAETKLRRILNANFTENDLHINLGYKRAKDEPHRTKDEMKDDIKKFLRSLRTECKKIGIELKYVHVMEIGEKGARHHHLVINNIDIKILTKLWKFGRPHIHPLDDSGQYAKLAAYLIKYTDKTVGTEKALQGKRWNSSKNLIHPESEYNIISNRAYYRAEAKVPKKYAKQGYYVEKESISHGVDSCEYSGYGYFRYTIVKRE